MKPRKFRSQRTAAAPGSRRRSQRQAGFTLIELMIVIGIILILISFAVPNYQQSIVRAREAVLRQDLYSMRESIEQFTEDKLRGPQSLDELVSANYMKQLPLDPLTNSRTTWQVEQGDILLSIDQSDPGISDVHSGAPGVGSDGTAYSSW